MLKWPLLPHLQPLPANQHLFRRSITELGWLYRWALFPNKAFKTLNLSILRYLLDS